MSKIEDIFNKQKLYFNDGKTKDIKFRIDNLKKLKAVIKNNEKDILNALRKDLGKSEFEGYVTELAMVYEEINTHIKKVKTWVKTEKRKSPIEYYPAKSYVYKEPYGVVLIIGPFNYPFQLVIAPLVGAISAGNTIIIKPSENTINTALLIERLINDNFDDRYIKVVNPLGGKEVVTELLELSFDLIFFTGSVRVGKIVMEKAAKNLTPVILELGGKSPCIVDKDAKIELAAKRIVWGKFLNAGQTCVAPDYLYVNKSVKDRLLKAIVKELKTQFGDNIKESLDFARIVNKQSVERLKTYLNDGEIYFGGEYDVESLYFEPTVLININENTNVMIDEIFGPILPVKEFDNLEEVIEYVNFKPKPLALYYFSENKNNIDYIISRTTSGGVTINDTIIHVANGNLPFGGIGTSGLGNYHGKESFEAFTHKRSIMKRGTFIEFNIRFAPYGERVKLLRKIMK